MVHMDVVTAFLNPDIDVETYMALPDFMGNIKNENGHMIPGGTVVKLLKALLGTDGCPTRCGLSLDRETSWRGRGLSF